MAINALILKVLLDAAGGGNQVRRLVCLGYPDMLVTEEQLAALCGRDILNRVRFRDDGETILRWHGLHGAMRRVVETRSFFNELNISSDFIDIHASRGVEIPVDLNEKLPRELRGQYDLIYDGGTMEHCFNVGQAISNILMLGRVGARIVHVNPLNYYNHGFFAFNPTFYHDFYTQSGNRLAADIYGVYGPVLDSRLMTLPALAGFRSIPERLAVMVVAEKLIDAEPRWPTQSKYQSNPELRG